MSSRPISIQLWTVRDLFAAGRVEETLDRLAEIGLAGIEGIPTGYDAPSFRRWLDDRGMSTGSYYGPFPTEENLDEICTTLDTLGAKWLTGGFWIQDLADADAIRASADRLAPMIERLESRGFGFAMHNHWMEFEPVDGRLVVDHLIELVPGLQLELDIYWASAFGLNDSAEMARRYADRTVLMHTKDGPLVRDAPMTALGEGKVDVEACVLAAPTAEWLIIELDAHDGDMLAAVERSYRFLTERGLGHGR